MSESRRWVLETHMEGQLFITGKADNLPARQAREFLTPYALLEPNTLAIPGYSPRHKLFLGLETPADGDQVCIAYQEAEAFARALAVNKGVPITLHVIVMIGEPDKWPQGIGFLRARQFPRCLSTWQPVDHYSDPKNRVSSTAVVSGWTGTRGLGTGLEEQHSQFCQHDEYRVALVGDYLAALDVEYKHPSLAMLYYAKVLERVAKTRFGAPKKGYVNEETMEKLIKEMDSKLTGMERGVARNVLRWRHNKSEAHLITEGTPKPDELRMCKKMAKFFLTRELVLSQTRP